MKVKNYILLISFLINNNAVAITCSNPGQECVEPGGTRNFDGIPVTLDCWKYKTTYECKAAADNNCKQLALDGCSPATTTCKTMWGNVCAVREVTYDCPTRKCDGSEIICNEGGGFCLTGNCVPQERSKDPNMHRALSALAAAAEASKAFTKSPVIFNGKPMECSDNFLGAKSCCGINPSGWAEGVFLECADDEIELAAKKEAGLAAEIGRYCHNEVLGVCTSHHKTYCVFGSKLGRILRVAANSQLDLSFGDPEHAVCNGLTIEQFQRLDFSKIDFSEFYKDIENKQITKTKNYDPATRAPGAVKHTMQEKAEGLKTKLQGKAQDKIKRADELRIRR